MSYINIPDIIANEMSFMPLPKTWYEEEVDGDTTKTIRFSNRRTHSGVLIRINKAEFYEEN